MIDLHTHSAASDGSDSPNELVVKAAANNLEVLALTDHDTLSGLAEAEEAARDNKIIMVRGCELSTSGPLGKIHILGLWLPQSSPELDNFLRKARMIREERNEKMIAKMRALGLDISLEEVASHAGGTVGRPHMATTLVEKGYAQNYDEAFELYLGNKGKAYIAKTDIFPQEAVELLSGIGATVSIAHPFHKNSNSAQWLENLARKLIPYGLSAIEAWHSSHNEQQTKTVLNIIDRLGLQATGGSDYHGLAKKDIMLGKGKNNLNIPFSVYENLIRARQARGLPV